MKLLVTGGAGFIGSNFIRNVLEVHAAWQVLNLDKLTYAGNLGNLVSVEDNPRYDFRKGDIVDRELVETVMASFHPDVIVNFAAESHVDRSILDATPFVRTNIEGTQVLLEAAKKYPVKKFIHVSTDEVYGSLGETGVFVETSPLLPNSPYAASKAAAELMCRSYWKSFGIPIVITRSSNNYGPHQFPEKLIPLMIWNAMLGKPLPLYGEGKQVRDWLYVEDNCRAIDLLLRNGRPGEAYNIGGSCEKQNGEVVEAICKNLKAMIPHLEPQIEFIKDPRGAAHDFRYALDSSKLARSLGWEPTVDFERGLKLTVEWYVENQRWIDSVVSGEYQQYYEAVYG